MFWKQLQLEVDIDEQVRRSSCLFGFFLVHCLTSLNVASCSSRDTWCSVHTLPLQRMIMRLKCRSSFCKNDHKISAFESELLSLELNCSSDTPFFQELDRYASPLSSDYFQQMSKASIRSFIYTDHAPKHSAYRLSGEHLLTLIFCF